MSRGRQRGCWLACMALALLGLMFRQPGMLRAQRPSAKVRRVPPSTLDLFRVEQRSQTPSWEASCDCVRATAVAFADLEEKSAAARERARSQAKRALHRWVDEALRRQGASPQTAAELHRRIEAESRWAAVQALAEGSVLAVLEMPAAALRPSLAKELRRP